MVRCWCKSTDDDGILCDVKYEDIFLLFRDVIWVNVL